MTAADAPADEPVTVEIPSHEAKEMEGSLLVDTTTSNSSVLAEETTPNVDNTVTEATISNTTEPSPISELSPSSEPLQSEKLDVEESKDDKEEGQSIAEQRVPADIATQRRMEQEQEISCATKEVIEPLKMLRKGATAVVGGAMVGVGLVMIPLPTPMGCVVASSGMAILGSEFEGAKEMNERLKEKGKEHLTTARDKAIAHIESMNSNNDTDDDSVGSEEEESPGWLKNMNEAERKRQQKLMKQKYREETLSANEKIKQYVKKGTGSFLSRNILPALHRTKNWGKEEAMPDKVSPEGAPEETEPKELDAASSPTSCSETQSSSEKLEKGKGMVAESLMASFNATSASFSSLMKRMSPQQAEVEKKMDFDEEINFGENATEAKDAAFTVNDDLAAPTAAAQGTLAETEPATATVFAI